MTDSTTNPSFITLATGALNFADGTEAEANLSYNMKITATNPDTGETIEIPFVVTTTLNCAKADGIVTSAFPSPSAVPNM